MNKLMNKGSNDAMTTHNRGDDLVDRLFALSRDESDAAVRRDLIDAANKLTGAAARIRELEIIFAALGKGVSNGCIEFPKIARLSREIVVTEKIDGSNGAIHIGEFMNGAHPFFVGSRSRWITPEDDNFGFARWAHEHREELCDGLGVGTHFGEWWGSGIQRRYGQDRKRFSLFNVSRWAESRPACCDVVPTLYVGPFDTHRIDVALQDLAISGSIAAPGFMDPEGIVVWHTAARVMFKKTIKKDAEWKGKQP